MSVLCGNNMNILYYLLLPILLLVAAAVRGHESPPPPPPPSDDERDDYLDTAEDGLSSYLGPIDELEDVFENFDGYEYMDTMDDDGLDDLRVIHLIFADNKRKRREKYRHERECWADHAEMLLATDQFEQRFRMPKEHFDYLLEAIEECITVDFMRSMNSTGGNDPIYPEIILAMGIRFIGMGSCLGDLSDIYGVSMASVRRCINMFLDAIDYNTSCKELQVKLPDVTDIEALDTLAQKWASVSTAYGLYTKLLGCIDGWLPHTEMPRGVPNQTDYFSGHYQCHGLNVQAVCDPDLLFMYVAVAAPGKVNDARSFHRCKGLLEWLEALPLDYYIFGDNAYTLSRRVLIPFTKAELQTEYHRTYNYFLSQLRMRIEMAFGRLTTKWRILRRALNYSNEKNGKIIRVCTKLHNFCIRMQQHDGDDNGTLGVIVEDTVDPSEYGIDALQGEGNRNSDFGYLETHPHPEDDPQPLPRVHPRIHSTLVPDSSLRSSYLADITSRGMRRPLANIRRNMND